MHGPRRILERLALEQPGQQEVAFLPAGQLLLHVDVVRSRQETAGLQLQKHGRDQEELGGDFQIEGGLHGFQGGDVGVDDVGEGNFPQIDLLSGDEVQEQIERALEDRGAHRVGHAGHNTCGAPSDRGIP